MFTFKNTKIYYLCSYLRKAFAHVVAVSVSVTFIVTLLYLKQVTRSVSIHEIQVNNIRSNKEEEKLNKM